MGLIYARVSIEMILAEHGDLTESELLDINSRSYNAVPHYIQTIFKRIRADKSPEVGFKEGKYVLKQNREQVIERFHNEPVSDLIIQLAFFAHNYKPAFWKKKIE